MVAEFVSRKTIGRPAIVAPKRATMVTMAIGRFINRPTRSGNRTYDKFFIYVPTELARDSSFPFSAGTEVEIAVDLEKRLLMIRAFREKPGKRQEQR